ncbi:hypothetical protein I552_5137 [Mycobacterium xenopi 3993]|nr:hypothetical protein I552_5137 [Mycobacterium xenopi 3993]
MNSSNRIAVALPETKNRFHAVHRTTDRIRDRMPRRFDALRCQ